MTWCWTGNKFLPKSMLTKISEGPTESLGLGELILDGHGFRLSPCSSGLLHPSKTANWAHLTFHLISFLPEGKLQCEGLHKSISPMIFFTNPKGNLLALIQCVLKFDCYIILYMTQQLCGYSMCKNLDCSENFKGKYSKTDFLSNLNYDEKSLVK